MAFRRKDIKKSSYYVWFLGAKESEGLRGEDFVIPVLRYLLDREGLSEPSKVTLQVSNKGMKIIQNVPKKASKLSLSSVKTEQIKHLIPHNAITCVVQEDDLVACILLIYNPITKCPVHVHAYRCDSVETATALKSQLQILIERPENQRKFLEIESRLASKGLVPATANANTSASDLAVNRKYNQLGKRLSSDGRSSTHSSERTETDDSFDSGSTSGKETGSGKPVPLELALSNPKVAILYESLAAELKAKLSNPKSGPILLPPRDYDTISRKQGKLTGIEARKSTNTSIVRPGVDGPKERQTKLSRLSGLLSSKNKIPSESSCKSSSGIGSDEAIPLSAELGHHYRSGKMVYCSSDDSERNWSPIESGTGSAGGSSGNGSAGDHRPVHRSSLGLADRDSRLLLESRSSSHSSSSNNLVNSVSSRHHHSHHQPPLSRYTVPPPITPKTASLAVKPDHLTKTKSDLKPPIVTAVKPHSSLVNSKVTNVDNSKHSEPPRYYFPDPTYGQVKPSSVVNKKTITSSALTSSSPDYERQRPPSSYLSDPCTRLKPIRDFIRVGPLPSYQRSPIYN